MGAFFVMFKGALIAGNVELETCFEVPQLAKTKRANAEI